MGSSAAIDVVELSHFYGQRKALDGVSFSILPGEIFAFLGPNGGGKTTLFRILSTLLRPQAGTVRIFGNSVVEDLLRVRQRLGIVFGAESR